LQRHRPVVELFQEHGGLAQFCKAIGSLTLT
jgi:hypothetical protein